MKKVLLAENVVRTHFRIGDKESRRFLFTNKFGIDIEISGNASRFLDKLAHELSYSNIMRRLYPLTITEILDGLNERMK